MSRRRKLGLSAGALVLAGCLVAYLASLGGPTSGWGKNDRAWGDDEFWMDVLVQGVGWMLVVASILVSARFFYTQRADEMVARREEAAVQAMQLRLARSARSVIEVERLLSQVVAKVQEVTRATRARPTAGDVRSLAKAVRLTIDELFDVALRLPNDDFFDFILQVVDDVEDFFDVLMSFLEDLEAPQGNELTDEERKTLKVYGRAFRRMMMAAQASLGRYEEGQGFLPKGIAPWGVALESARRAEEKDENPPDAA